MSLCGLLWQVSRLLFHVCDFVAEDHRLRCDIAKRFVTENHAVAAQRVHARNAARRDDTKGSLNKSIF